MRSVIARICTQDDGFGAVDGLCRDSGYGCTSTTMNVKLRTRVEPKRNLIGYTRSLCWNCAVVHSWHSSPHAAWRRWFHAVNMDRGWWFLTRRWTKYKEKDSCSRMKMKCDLCNQFNAPFTHAFVEGTADSTDRWVDGHFGMLICFRRKVIDLTVSTIYDISFLQEQSH